MIPWWKTDFGDAEIDAVAGAITNRHISQGPITKRFEEQIGLALSVPYVVCTTSGTTALTMALIAAGIGHGDEVIVPNRTWIATAHAVMMAGATVVLVDVEPDRPAIDVAQVEAKITPRTKAIMPVHLNGRACDMDALLKLAAAYDLHVIEDAAQAIGSRTPHYHLGTQGHMGAFSLSTAKLIATGQGGFVVTRDETLYRKLKAIRTHDVEDAMVPQVLQWRRFGFNFRYTDLQAAIGLVQLGKLEERISFAREIHKIYSECLPPELTILPVGPLEVPVYNEVLCPDPEKIRAELKDAGIEARPFYPALNTAKYLFQHGRYPNSERFSRGFILPSGPGQKIEDIRRVCEVLEQCSETAPSSP